MKILAMLLLGLTLVLASVDINTAGKKELSSLYGIGAKKAQAIISYREGSCFKKIEEIQKVKGVGPKTFMKNKDNLIVSECKKE